MAKVLLCHHDLSFWIIGADSELGPLPVERVDDACYNGKASWWRGRAIGILRLAFPKCECTSIEILKELSYWQGQHPNAPNNFEVIAEFGGFALELHQRNAGQRVEAIGAHVKRYRHERLVGASENFFGVDTINPSAKARPPCTVGSIP